MPESNDAEAKASAPDYFHGSNMVSSGDWQRAREVLWRARRLHHSTPTPGPCEDFDGASAGPGFVGFDSDLVFGRVRGSGRLESSSLAPHKNRGLDCTVFSR